MKKLGLLPALLLVSVAVTYAQKLPKVQTASVWAPKDIKIDGKTTEWNDQFQAHNQPNHIYYTLSNDDNNLYFTARMDDLDGSKKILRGGITFTITSVDKKGNNVSVTFPVIKKRSNPEGKNNPTFVYTILTRDTVKNKAKIDSLIVSANSDIPKIDTEIHIMGIPEINDPFQPVNNSRGIRAGASYDKKMRYTYELAIPLKYMESSINNVKSIHYNIKLNAEPINFVRKIAVQTSTSLTLVDPNSHPNPIADISDMFDMEDSHFSGVYTLAKKP